MLKSALFSSALFGLATAGPVKKWDQSSVGANYFATNGFGGNQLVASYILPDGALAPGTATWTGGNGSAGINDPNPYENHPDPFYASASVIVVNNQVMVVNAGTNSFSVFDIDPADPARPQLSAVYPSHGEFPISLAASKDEKTVCVLNAGAKNGFGCFTAGANGWNYDPAWERDLGLNLTTPPHGPIGSTPSQLAFASDQAALVVVVKGFLPVDLNNPSNQTIGGYLATYAISNGKLAETPVKTPAAQPFSIDEDLRKSGSYFLSDVVTGYAVYEPSVNSSLQAGVIPYQGAVCWVAQSKLTGNFYTVDIAGTSNITEVSIDLATLKGTVVRQHHLGVNASGTDLSIYYGQKEDWMYVNAPAYKSVHAYKITGPGMFSLIQRYDLKDMPTDVYGTKGFSGQAIYYK